MTREKILKAYMENINSNSQATWSQMLALADELEKVDNEIDYDVCVPLPFKKTTIKARLVNAAPVDRECGVCWSGGEIDIDDDMRTVKCWECGGTGRVPIRQESAPVDVKEVWNTTKTGYTYRDYERENELKQKEIEQDAEQYADKMFEGKRDGRWADRKWGYYDALNSQPSASLQGSTPAAPVDVIVDVHRMVDEITLGNFARARAIGIDILEKAKQRSSDAVELKEENARLRQECEKWKRASGRA